MNTSMLDPVLLAAGTLLQLVMFVLLIRKRAFSRLPVFVIYSGYSFVAVFVSLALVSLSQEAHAYIWMTETVFETALYLLVLRELRQAVLRFNRIPAGPRWLVILLFLIGVAVIWTAAQWQISLAAYPFIWRFVLYMLQATTVLQAAAFATLVGWSSLNKLRWPSREFRIASGMGIWTVVALAALMLHNDGFTGGIQNHWVDQLTPVSCLLVMAWWVQYFWFEPPQIEEAQESPVLELAGGGAEN